MHPPIFVPAPGGGSSLFPERMELRPGESASLAEKPCEANYKKKFAKFSEGFIGTSSRTGRRGDE
jgi:hypothetical protein